MTRPVLAAKVTSFVIEPRSSRWQYDQVGGACSCADGNTTWLELDNSAVGNHNSEPDPQELRFADLLFVSMTVEDGERHTDLQHADRPAEQELIVAISGFSFARRDDRGSALIITLMVMALVTALSSTVAVLTINNLQASRQAQQAGSAINAADAGVAQAMSYLRTSGVKGLTCSPTCSANPWGNSTTPTSVSLPGPGGEAYKAWIEVVTAFPNATNTPGEYTIHSTGSASGAAQRSVAVDVNVATDAIRAMFARTIDGGGSASVTRESVISTGCVYDRDHIHMVTGQMDAAYGIPIAVHSSQYITRSNGSAQYCPSSDNGLIHKDGALQHDVPVRPGPARRQLSPARPAPVCHQLPLVLRGGDLDGDGTGGRSGSYLKNDDALVNCSGSRSRRGPAGADRPAPRGDHGPRQATGRRPRRWAVRRERRRDVLRPAGGRQRPRPSTSTTRVVSIAPVGPDAERARMPERSRSVIVIESGNASLNSNHELFASLILTSVRTPTGRSPGRTEPPSFIGPIYADSINLVGNVDISLDGCFLANLSPSLLDVQMSKYRENDRGLS